MSEAAERSATRHFREARDLLLQLRTDSPEAYRRFQWPALSDFNWALDWFDVIAHDNARTALRGDPYKRIRRLEFSELPKTLSGKIRRVDLRKREEALYRDAAARPEGEFRDEDFR
jgi:hypothetical protein